MWWIVLIWIVLDKMVLVGILLGSDGWIVLESMQSVLTSEGWIVLVLGGIILGSEGWIELVLGGIVLYRIESVLDRFGIVDEGPLDMVVLV